ncbi:MAG: UDP-4-amino-4,6-dideoxy-N-acetyl-beta-L-altrosamine transaminase, partial [Nanohaloarchaea archaeon]|nr:UDP-4-amino-4,6-dideoxy-N-acetyl-beta-L-altrosamine transaminase [Candidatus Nanohaloarchaea archaeon]
MRNYIPYCRQLLDEDDIRSVCDVLRKDWITNGPKITEFQDIFSKYIGCRHSLAVSSGTAAL